ncbi:MAG TPA: ECF-type sigma factor [Blastocatellia bacterium]|nr:ECF-type sigma factor [Blastocatellia bacterium]HMZ22827.1 ECF-type sigma factor [Blastocatellia bacterium]HNG30520.1 ECF-type sigma factor [Blastocatellia bacterium]
MDTPSPQEVTQWLSAWSAGDAQALERLVPLVEAELHRMARVRLRNERAGHTLQTTALVNEAFMRLIDWQNIAWESRTQFFGVAAGVMRNVLVDHARKRKGIKVSLSEADGQSTEREADFEALHDALTTLEQFDPRRGRIVELKFFGGLAVEEIATFLGISPRTVAREWKLARAWLFHQLSRA